MGACDRVFGWQKGPDNSDYEERWHSVQFQGNVPHLSRSDVVSLIASGKPQALAE
jgi:hypothetical protein